MADGKRTAQKEKEQRETSEVGVGGMTAQVSSSEKVTPRRVRKVCL